MESTLEKFNSRVNEIEASVSEVEDKNNGTHPEKAAK